MAQFNHHIVSGLNRDVLEGLLFIPDISGFTRLVHSTDVLTGKQITYELLSTIINQNNLELSIAEVEGDAVLFYRYGPAPSVAELVEQYEKMKDAFERKLEELQINFSQAIDLSLKVIAHYGIMTEFKIGDFKKLYGKVVIEAHRLLKNSITSDNYLLLTDSLLERTGIEDQAIGRHGNRHFEGYNALRDIHFTYFDFNERRTWKKVA